MQQTSVQKENVLQDKKGGNVMFKQMKKRIKNEKGLTLIELLAVIVILAIVAAIAIPAIGNIIDNSRYNAVKADAINVLNAAQLYYTENTPATAVTVQGLIDADFLESRGKIPASATISITKPHELSGATVQDVVGTYDVTFTGATIDEINADTTKGSAISANVTIGN